MADSGAAGGVAWGGVRGDGWGMIGFSAGRWIELGRSRVRVRCAGPDAARYLNGQLTNDVALVRDGRTLPACITNAKGKMEAEVVVAPWGADDFLIDAPAELADFLPLRLEKYLIADDCQIIDADPLAAHFFLPGGETGLVVPAGSRTVSAWRFGVPGTDLLVPDGGGIPDLPALSEAELEDARIRQGAPRWGAELGGDTLPPEAMLDHTHISYTKGCYIGQETISRLKSVGRTTRLLRQITATGGLRPDMELFPVRDATDDARPLGRITSATSDGTVALGYLRRSYEGDGSDLVCRNTKSGESISVSVREIIPNPFPA